MDVNDALEILHGFRLAGRTDVNEAGRVLGQEIVKLRTGERLAFEKIRSIANGRWHVSRIERCEVIALLCEELLKNPDFASG